MTSDRPPGGETVLANVSLSSTFDDLPELRDMLLSWPSERLSLSGWQDRSDVAVFAGDGTEARWTSPVVRREVDKAAQFGTPTFVLRSTPSSRLRARAVQVDRDEQDRVSCLRLVDAIEDHLFHQDLDAGALPGPDDLGEWLRQDLAAAGVLGGPDPRQESEPLLGGHPTDQFRDLVRHLRVGEVDEALMGLLRPDGSPIGGWPAGYVLGRLYAARGRFEELAPSSAGEVRRSAAEVLDAAYWDLRADRPLADVDAAAARACVLALIRVTRRFAPGASQQWLTLLDRHLGRPAGGAGTVVDVEQIRLDGRQGAERLDSVVSRVTDLLWRSPDLAERLLVSQDVQAVREQAVPRLVDAIRDAMDRASHAVVQPPPDIIGDDLADAVDTARSYASECAAAIRRDLLSLDSLSDDTAHPSRLTVEVRRDELLRRREDRSEGKDARDRAGVELAARARRAGLPSEIADPLNLPRPALGPSTDPVPDHEADAALLALPTEIDVRLERAARGLEAARSEHRRLLRRNVPRPERPSGRRAQAALGGSALVVLSVILWAVLLEGSALFAALTFLGLAVVAICCGPWGLRTLHHRDLARRHTELDAAEEAHRLAASARDAGAEVRRLDDELVTRAKAEARAADRYLAATVQRDRVARQLGLSEGCTATAFAEAVRDRLAGLGRAFAGSPRFWWADVVVVHPVREGDLMGIDETSPVRGGLLEGSPGPRLLRAVDLDGQRVASDVWAVFGREERRTALALERRLQAWLSGRTT